MLYTIKKALRNITPSFILSGYHLLWAYTGAVLYGSPARSLNIIGVTGTKGKTSTTEFINAIFEAAGEKTALSNSIRTKIGTESARNTNRMSMPGRMALQQFYAKAKKAECTTVIVEMTSEGAKLHRHRFSYMNALVFTNLAPEHIESHGSLEKYIQAKLSIGKELSQSPKRPRILVARSNDPVSKRFLEFPTDKQILFALAAHQPYRASDRGGSFTFEGTPIAVNLPGEFSLWNAVAAAEVARAYGIIPEHIKKGIESVTTIPGRAELIDAGQDFTVVVDYAHNPSSLEALYSAYEGRRRICVLGATGGGRDTWKRPEMGRLADTYCDEIVLTNEDPYDEDPEQIISAVAAGIHTKKPHTRLDRRDAIKFALSFAQKGDVVLITGKGTDPTIQEKGGAAKPWSDAAVARELLERGF